MLSLEGEHETLRANESAVQSDDECDACERDGADVMVLVDDHDPELATSSTSSTPSSAGNRKRRSTSTLSDLVERSTRRTRQAQDNAVRVERPIGIVSPCVDIGRAH